MFYTNARGLLQKKYFLLNTKLFAKCRSELSNAVLPLLAGAGNTASPQRLWIGSRRIKAGGQCAHCCCQRHFCASRRARDAQKTPALMSWGLF